MAANQTLLLGIADQEDIRIDVTMSVNGDISGDTFKAVLKNPAGVVVATKTLASGITLAAPGTGSSPGVLEVYFAAADIHAATLGQIPNAQGLWMSSYEIWRVTAGRQARLVYGPCPIAVEAAV